MGVQSGLFGPKALGGTAVGGKEATGPSPINVRISGDGLQTRTQDGVTTQKFIPRGGFPDPIRPKALDQIQQNIIDRAKKERTRFNEDINKRNTISDIERTKRTVGPRDNTIPDKLNDAKEKLIDGLNKWLEKLREELRKSAEDFKGTSIEVKLPDTINVDGEITLPELGNVLSQIALLEGILENFVNNSAIGGQARTAMKSALDAFKATARGSKQSEGEVT